jgi:hypothetical protein
MIRFVVVAVAIQIVLLVWALFDIYFTPADRIRRYPRRVWVLIAFINIIGPIAWMVWGRPQRPKRGGGGRGRPIAPDDDPDFLSKL